jgi:NADH-quinone oxidoreductase subunit L
MSFPMWMLVPCLPLGAALLISLWADRLKEQSYKVGVPAVAGSFVLSCWALFGVVQQEDPAVFSFSPVVGMEWLQAGLLLDRLSAVMIVLITGVSTVVHLYSVRYMWGEPGYARFYALLGFMTSILLWMVLSGNLFMLLLCWHLVSWCLYLLLAFNRASAQAMRYARKALAVHLIGDVAFLAGAVLAYSTYGVVEFAALFEAARLTAASVPLWPGGPAIDAVGLITFGIFIGAMAKSAQVPLHIWLPDTMDTPTPVSALMHAGIVNAGGFLLNRLAPLYGMAPTTLHVVLIIGSLTALLGATMMLVQSDIKKTLGFSTMGQMGYMTMECGLGAFALAIFHLMAHGLFKATLFLNAGSGIHSARHEPRMPTTVLHRETGAFSQLSWWTGFSVTLMLPLVIVLAAHGVLQLPLHNTQGAVVFLFFSWVTASQAIISLYRLQEVASWKVAAAMVGTMAFIVTVYLWAGEVFTYFLYPDADTVAAYFEAAALDWLVFDVLVGITTLCIVAGWVFLYISARGRHMAIPAGILDWYATLYVAFLNRLYLDALYQTCGRRVGAWCRRVGDRVYSR